MRAAKDQHTDHRKVTWNQAPYASPSCRCRAGENKGAVGVPGNFSPFSVFTWLVGPTTLVLTPSPSVLVETDVHGIAQATDQITPSNESKLSSSSEIRSSRKSAHAERYGEPDAEDVYNHADNHHLNRKRQRRAATQCDS